jgi:hypothetical protein
LATPSTTNQGSNGSNLIFHLDKHCAYFGGTFRKTLGGFRRRSDRIASEKSATSSQSTFRNGVVTIHKMGAGIDSLGVSSDNIHIYNSK